MTYKGIRTRLKPDNPQAEERTLTREEINENLDAFNQLQEYFDSIDGDDILANEDISPEDLYESEDEEDFSNVLEKVVYYYHTETVVNKIGKTVIKHTWTPKVVYLGKTVAKELEEKELEKKFSSSEEDDFETVFSNEVKLLSDQTGISENEIDHLRKILEYRNSPAAIEGMLKGAAKWRKELREYRQEHRQINKKTGRYKRRLTPNDYKLRQKYYQDSKKEREEDQSFVENKERIAKERQDRMLEQLRYKVGKIVEQKQLAIAREAKKQALEQVYKRGAEILARLNKQTNSVKIRPDIVRPKTISDGRFDYDKYDKQLFDMIRSSIDYEYASPRSVMNVYETEDIFELPETSVASQRRRSGQQTRHGRSGRVYKRAVLLTPAKIPKIYRFNRLYGCIIAATFFQLLVSNTPIDEPYVFTRRVKRKKKNWVKIRLLNGQGINARARSAEDLAEEMLSMPKIVYYNTRETHTPDEKSVRADWVLTFRGKNFKAWDSEQEDYSEQVNIDGYMKPEWFENKGDQWSINEIAEFLVDHTDEYNFDLNFEYNNLNPRWEILEKGGYTTNSNPKVGSRYGFEHGVTNGFSYQAPKGFIRIIEAYWNMTIESGRWNGHVSNFINKTKRTTLDVSNVYSDLMQEIQDYDHFIGDKYFTSLEIGEV